MTQELLPEILTATQALEQRITKTEAEIMQMNHSIDSKKQLIKTWREAALAINPNALAKSEEESNPFFF